MIYIHDTCVGRERAKATHTQMLLYDLFVSVWSQKQTQRKGLKWHFCGLQGKSWVSVRLVTLKVAIEDHWRVIWDSGGRPWHSQVSRAGTGDLCCAEKQQMVNRGDQYEQINHWRNKSRTGSVEFVTLQAMTRGLDNSQGSVSGLELLMPVDEPHFKQQ